MSKKRIFWPQVPSIPICLVMGDSCIKDIPQLKGYQLPPIGGAVAKAILVKHHRTGRHYILVFYPTLLVDKEQDVLATLVHEGAHCVDFIKEHFGYTNDSEFNAYLSENIYTNLSTIYRSMKEVKHA